LFIKTNELVKSPNNSLRWLRERELSPNAYLIAGSKCNKKRLFPSGFSYYNTESTTKNRSVGRNVFSRSPVSKPPASSINEVYHITPWELKSFLITTIPQQQGITSLRQ